ncbi:MAG: hypothetical protein R3E75_07625 [Steroidobacteraceae bacterium]|nr:hypothetical protein [Nevskiaceae bacterium]MCP5340242.1 hypothetical protein [Nevskiaceae bacterium]
MTLANMALEAVDECLFGANVPIAPWRDTGARISAWVDFPCKVPPCGVSRGLDVPANPMVDSFARISRASSSFGSASRYDPQLSGHIAPAT